MDINHYATLFGKPLRTFKKGKSDYVTFQDGSTSAIRFSTEHGDGKYWYSIVPNVLTEYKMLKINSHIFCFNDFGAVNLPFNILIDYLKNANTTLDNLTGSIKKYQIRMRFFKSINQCFLYSGKGQKGINVSNYFNGFTNNLNSIIQNDLESLSLEDNFEEGKKYNRYVSFFERNLLLRTKAIELHGQNCLVCGFDFFNFYGEIGKNFIEVHHIIPVSQNVAIHSVNPQTDLVVLCSNCHRMIHRKKDNVLSVEQLKEIIKDPKSYK